MFNPAQARRWNHPRRRRVFIVALRYSEILRPFVHDGVDDIRIVAWMSIRLQCCLARGIARARARRSGVTSTGAGTTVRHMFASASEQTQSSWYPSGAE